MSLPAFTYATKSLCLLTKPRIILGNVITTAGGFALASKGKIDFTLFFITLLGLSLIIASACVFNNYIDRFTDQKMARTKNRALASGLISIKSAIVWAVFLGICGASALLYWTNLLTLGVALFGFFGYVILYSLSKYHSIHGTLIGSISGAVPPVVGYTAVSNHLDLGAFLFFALMVLWQMPHFFAIALYRLNDYAAAEIPVLPVKKGAEQTKKQMFIYIIAFVLSASLLTVFGYTGKIYLFAVLFLGLLWLVLSGFGFRSSNIEMWGKRMFLFSLLVIIGICFSIPFSVKA